jgi:hypothetical protein
MILAKLALGFGGTLVLAGAYTFHEGVVRIDQEQADGQHFHFWVPAAAVPMAMHLVPKRELERVTAEAGPWFPAFRALTKELKRYPEAELLDVRGSDHVRIRTHLGKLLIDVDEELGDQVHVVCPLATMEDIASELEANAPGA